MPTVDDINEMMIETSGEVYVELITLEAMGEPTGYLVIDTQELVSRGNTYQPADISFEPAKKSGQELSEASITISNITRELIDELRTAHEEPTITAELVARSRPDTVIETNGPYQVRDATFTTNAIQLRLQASRIFDEAFPAMSYTPSTAPGCFA